MKPQKFPCSKKDSKASLKTVQFGHEFTSYIISLKNFSELKVFNRSYRNLKECSKAGTRRTRIGCII